MRFQQGGKRLDVSPDISPETYRGRRSAHKTGPYCLWPRRRSGSYALLALSPCAPVLRHLDALAANGGEKCRLALVSAHAQAVQDQTEEAISGTGLKAPAQVCLTVTAQGYAPLVGGEPTKVSRGLTDHYTARSAAETTNMEGNAMGVGAVMFMGALDADLRLRASDFVGAPVAAQGPPGLWTTGAVRGIQETLEEVLAKALEVPRQWPGRQHRYTSRGHNLNITWLSVWL